MKLISVRTRTPKEELLDMLTDPTAVNDKVKFEGKRGTPTMRIKQKGDNLKIKCTYMNGPTRDNGWIQGTYFRGTIKEHDGVTTLKGFIVTEPIFHLVLVGLTVFFIVWCIILSGFNVVPPILLVVSIIMMIGEYKKQPVIERYLYRALRKADEKHRFSIRRQMLDEESKSDIDGALNDGENADFPAEE